MILKIDKSKYYGYNGKTKELFKKKYRSLKLKWMESVAFEGGVVDGWFSEDLKQYLLKLAEEGEFKRFTGNSVGMIEFLKNYGGVVVEGEERGSHIDYNDMGGYMDQVERYGRFLGGDLVGHYRVEEMLRGVEENWGVRWGDGSYLRGKDDGSMSDKNDDVMKLINEKLISESLKNKKRRIVKIVKVVKVVRRK